MGARKYIALVSILAASLAACGSEEGVEDPLVAMEEEALTGVAPAGEPAASLFWTSLYETDIGRSPITNATRCGFDRHGWMLAGGLVMNVDRHFPTRTGFDRRACALPAGEQLLVPLATVQMDGVNAFPRPSVREMSTRVRDLTNDVRDLRLVVDGRDARTLGVTFERKAPQVFGYRLPPTGAVFAPPGGRRDIGPAVADGVFVTLPGFARGPHQVVIDGRVSGRWFHFEYVIDAR